MKIKSFRNTVKSALVCALAFGGLAAVTPAARAVPVPPEQELYATTVSAGQDPLADKVINFLVGPTDSSGKYAVDGTVLHLDTYSCGTLVSQTDNVVSPSTGRGVIVYYNDAQQNAISPSIEYVLTITQPGYDAYQRSGSYSGYGVARPSCAELASGGVVPDGCTVQTAAAKVGRARVGKTVKVRAPKTSGDCGKASYTWKASGKIVTRAKALRIGSGLKGKNLLVIVKLAQGKSTVLRFGRVV